MPFSAFVRFCRDTSLCLSSLGNAQNVVHCVISQDLKQTVEIIFQNKVPIELMTFAGCVVPPFSQGLHLCLAEPRRMDGFTMEHTALDDKQRGFGN